MFLARRKPLLDPNLLHNLPAWRGRRAMMRTGSTWQNPQSGAGG
jgi:hypothetical protein